MTDFDASLRSALHHLNKPSWYDPLHSLIQNFVEYPDDGIPIHAEFIDMLLNISTEHSRDPVLPISMLTALRIPKLSCWKLRAFKRANKDSAFEAWNPLLTPFSTFNAEHTDLSMASTAFPAEDIIKRWALDHLK